MYAQRAEQDLVSISQGILSLVVEDRHIWISWARWLKRGSTDQFQEGNYSFTKFEEKINRLILFISLS